MPKNANVYNCNKCNFKCSKKSNYDKHLTTRKHTNTYTYLPKDTLGIYTCNCGKEYNHRQSLYTHNKKCKNIGQDKNEREPTVQDTSANSMVELLIKENCDFKTMIMDLVKSNTELQIQVLDACQKIQPTTINNTNSNNHTTTNNKTFNLNFFLNEQCKDAMNISEFVNSVQLNLEDLERVGRQGYVDGIAHIISEKLKDTDIYKRPFHCSDAKRETLYVKDTNGWEREGAENLKMVKAVKDVGQKNFPILNEYRVLHPDCIKADSEYNDKYVQMMIQAAGSQKDNVIKVIKKLAKEVVIEKNN
jgi:hypothetical protein